METILQSLTKTADGLKNHQQERLILEITEKICEILAEDGVTRTELAHRLGKTKGHVTQLLDGEANMTIRTIADVFTALRREIGVIARELTIEDRETLAAMKQGAHVCTMTEDFDTDQQPWDLEDAGKATSPQSGSLAQVG